MKHRSTDGAPDDLLEDLDATVAEGKSFLEETKRPIKSSVWKELLGEITLAGVMLFVMWFIHTYFSDWDWIGELVGTIIAILVGAVALSIWLSYRRDKRSRER